MAEDQGEMRQMRFNGRLLTEADSKAWLKSEISISGTKVELSAGDDLLGSWPVGQVKAQRIEGDRFELYLGDDRAVFAADDALAFSYEALPKLAKTPLVEAAQGFRKLLGAGRKPPTPVEVPADVRPEPEVVAPGDLPANVKRLRELIEVARANRQPPAPAKFALEAEDEFVLDELPANLYPELPADPEPQDEHDPEPGPIWSRPEGNHPRPFAVAPEPKPVALSIVDPPAVDPGSVFGDDSDLADEIDQLAQQIKRSQLSEAQTEASINLIRSLRALLDS
ncbi:MAG: hypothetical protein ACR2NT_00185 [Acidimicrobiia bacterium]